MKIVLLGGKSESTLFLYNKLKGDFLIENIIIENKISTIKLLKARIKKFGFIKVIDQLLFQLFAKIVLKFLSKNRIKEIKEEYRFSDNPIPLDILYHVESVNSDSCLALLMEIKPDLVIVNGTRIISRYILSNIPCLFVNSHVGITPEYRGVHGAYWALVNKDIKNCGVTVHKVDEGIDTGELIKQRQIVPKAQDNFITYPYLQFGIGINLIYETILDFQNKNLSFYKKENAKSKLYTHPTFTEYLYNYFTKKVK